MKWTVSQQAWWRHQVPLCRPRQAGVRGWDCPKNFDQDGETNPPPGKIRPKPTWVSVWVACPRVRQLGDGLTRGGQIEVLATVWLRQDTWASRKWHLSSCKKSKTRTSKVWPQRQSQCPRCSVPFRVGRLGWQCLSIAGRGPRPNLLLISNQMSHWAPAVQIHSRLCSVRDATQRTKAVVLGYDNNIRWSCYGWSCSLLCTYHDHNAWCSSQGYTPCRIAFIEWMMRCANRPEGLAGKLWMQHFGHKWPHPNLEISWKFGTELTRTKNVQTRPKLAFWPDSVSFDAQLNAERPLCCVCHVTHAAVILCLLLSASHVGDTPSPPPPINKTKITSARELCSETKGTIYWGRKNPDLRLLAPTPCLSSPLSGLMNVALCHVGSRMRSGEFCWIANAFCKWATGS